MSGDKNNDEKIWRPPPWAVLAALAALAIVVGTASWVCHELAFDRELPKARLEALPGDGQAALQWKTDKTDNNGVKWQYEQRYAWRENEYNPPSRWQSLPEDQVVDGLANGWGYVFRVRAVRNGKPGPPSNEAVVTPTAVPARLDEIAELTRAFEKQLARIPSDPTRPPTPSVTDEQWTELIARLTAIETYLKTIAKEIRSAERTTIPRTLTLFRFPNARLSWDGVPAGDGVTVPEHAVVRAMAALDACARAGEPVTVRPYGFASKAPFRYADGTRMEDSDALNLKTAHLRARDACRALKARADAHPHVRIEDPRRWSSPEQMTRERDDGSLITYPDDARDREQRRRVVVLKVIAPGRCEFE